MYPDMLSLESAIEELETDGELPLRLRYCEGRDPKEGDKIISQRLFSGPKEIWLELEIAVDEIRATLEGLGFEAAAEQRVPDGWGRYYDSIYYLRNREPGSNDESSETAASDQESGPAQPN